MALDLVGNSDSLFERLGRLGKLVLQLNEVQADTQTVIDDVLGRYDPADEDLTGTLAVGRNGLLRAIPSATFARAQSLARQTVLRVVKADQPTKAGSFQEAITEVIRQMVAQSKTVQSCAVAVTPSAFGTNVGTGAVVVSTLRGDGKTQEQIVEEDARLLCTADALTGGATAGAERFQFVGVPNAAGVADWDWPQGSGGSLNLNSASALIDYPAGRNLLVNGSFDDWTTTTVDNWAGTGTFTKETTLVYRSGGNAVRAAAGQTPTLTQTFNVSTGTTAAPSILSSLAFALWCRGSAALSGGVLRVELLDGSNAAVNDATGNPARVDFALNGLGTTYTSVTGILRTPAILPTTLKIRVNVQTTPAGGDLIFDHLAVQPLAAAYTGGPGIAVFAGSTDWVAADGWDVATTNDRGGATLNATFQTLCDRLFGLSSLGLLLPSSGSPNVADTLITS